MKHPPQDAVLPHKKAARLPMDQQFVKRSDMDFLNRSLPGVLLYAVIWPLLAWSTDFYLYAPSFTLIFSGAFMGISLLRTANTLIPGEPCYFYWVSRRPPPLAP